MTGNHITRTDFGTIMWHQVARDRAERNVGERDIALTDVRSSVKSFDDFCSKVGADRYASIGDAMNEINAQTKSLLSDVYLAEREDDVRAFEPLVDAALSLFKELESFYVQHFGLRTGTY